MGKLIAVCGSPHSGKTTLALKLAQEIYFSKKGTSVIFLSPDLETPALGYIFPNYKGTDLYSMGVALDKTDIYREDILRQFVTVKETEDLVYLGYKLGENKYSYPELTEDKVLDFISELREMADYVIVDCTVNENDLISRIAKRDCDKAVQIFNPNVQSVVYYISCVNQFLSVTDKRIKVLNIMDNDIYLPGDEIKKCFGEMDCTVGYSRPLKQQMITGTLYTKIADPKYRAAVKKIAKAVS